MAIVGDRPETGMRIVLDRIPGNTGEAYAGRLSTPTEDFDIRVEGDVVTGAPAELEEKVRLLVRTAVKHAEADGRPPPARIARWRPL
jgi:hypothetical protein